MPVATLPDALVAGPSRSLAQTAHALAGQPADAEDLLQTAVAKALPRWRQITGEPEGYLRRVLVNEHISRWRRHRGREVLRADVPDRATAAGPDVAEQVTVRQAIAALPPRQRAVLVLRYYEDLTEADTARALGISRGTVKSQHHKALGRLRRTLGSSARVDDVSN